MKKKIKPLTAPDSAGNSDSDSDSDSDDELMALERSLADRNDLSSLNLDVDSEAEAERITRFLKEPLS